MQSTVPIILTKSVLFQVCMEYEPIIDGDPITIKSLPVNFEIKLDTGDGFSRVSFNFDDGKTSSFWKGKLEVATEDNSQVCTRTIDISYDNSTGNVQPMPVKFAAGLADVLGLSSLILDQGLIQDAETSLTIQSNCHPESGICDVDMKVDVDEKTLFDEQDLYPEVVFSYVNSITKKITVSNVGTAELYNYAYDIVVNVSLPENVIYNDYIGEHIRVDSKGSYVECYLLNEGPINEELIRSQTFYLTFDISSIAEATDLVFKVDTVVNDPTVDSDLTNNNMDAVVNVGKLADLIINGMSNRNRVPFNNQYTVVNRAIGSPDVIIRFQLITSYFDINEDAIAPH